ncbi:MAG: flagellar hook-basal body complex protein FliE [Pirellulaceae bacterium]|nr:MAG: flagellar hook-basal body complex protein FliE [Pirellulaceae bacterium]GIW95073.1 MAG: flagellar hook-basal body complex protein FliE [Pirellulaceae bacterium]
MTSGLPAIGNTVAPNLVHSQPGATPAGAAEGVSFRDLLLESLEHVNAMQKDAEQAIEQLASGQEVDVAQVITSIQKADLTFRLMLQIRNKLMQAYQELNQIRI